MVKILIMNILTNVTHFTTPIAQLIVVATTFSSTGSLTVAFDNEPKIRNGVPNILAFRPV